MKFKGTNEIEQMVKKFNRQELELQKTIKKTIVDFCNENNIGAVMFNRHYNDFIDSCYAYMDDGSEGYVKEDEVRGFGIFNDDIIFCLESDIAENVDYYPEAYDIISNITFLTPQQTQMAEMFFATDSSAMLNPTDLLGELKYTFSELVLGEAD